MKTLHHPNIVKVFETFEDNRSIHIIMELCVGGDPLRRIASTGHFTERQAAILMKQIFRGLQYMHALNICHRDLKPENFLLSHKSDIEGTSLKIIDFGFAIKFEPEQFLKTKVGSAYYIAPQVLTGQYTAACDLWSAGVVLYVMLCGSPPFRGPTEPIILSRVYRGLYSLDGAIWEDVSEDGKDHVRGLLTMDPKTRWTAADALRHIWIESVAPNSTGKDLSVNMVNNLRNFQSANRLKQAALQVIANHTKEAEIQKIHDAFLSIDERGDKDGVLSIEELKIALDEAGIRCPDLEAVVREVDAEGRSFLDYNHFIAATLDEGIYCREEHCWNAFNHFDRDGDGVISFKELSELLNSNEFGDLGQGMVEEIRKELQPAQEGMINFDEFLLMMRGGSKETSTRRASYPRTENTML